MAMCKVTGKTKFPNELAANARLATIQFKVETKHRKKGNRRIPTRSYECEFCHRWHLTGDPKRNEAGKSCPVSS